MHLHVHVHDCSTAAIDHGWNNGHTIIITCIYYKIRFGLVFIISVRRLNSTKYNFFNIKRDDRKEKVKQSRKKMQLEGKKNGEGMLCGLGGFMNHYFIYNRAGQLADTCAYTVMVKSLIMLELDCQPIAASGIISIKECHL